MTEILLDTLEVEKQTYKKNMSSLNLTAASRIDYMGITGKKDCPQEYPHESGQHCFRRGSQPCAPGGNVGQCLTGLLYCSLSSVGEI